MKIAVASTGAMTTEHFGHCENFNIFDAKTASSRGTRAFQILATSLGFCQIISVISA